MNCEIQGYNGFSAVHNTKHKIFGIKLYRLCVGNGYKYDMAVY
jgi:hypothetical protein